MQESHPFPVQSLFFKTLYNCEGSQVRSKPWAFKRALADRLHAQVMCWIHPGLPWQPPLFFFIQRKIVLSVNVPFHRAPWLLFRGLTALRSKRWAGPGISIITDPHCSLMLFILQLWVYQHLVSPPLLWVFGRKLSLPYCMMPCNLRFWAFSIIILQPGDTILSLDVLLSFPPDLRGFLVIFFKILFCCGSPAPRSHQVGSVPCSYHWQFLSDLKVKKKGNRTNQDEKNDTGCNTLISFQKPGSYFSK